jgi:1-phosphatidylinositol-4-phosphate 5-kinase
MFSPGAGSPADVFLQEGQMTRSKSHRMIRKPKNPRKKNRQKKKRKKLQKVKGVLITDTHEQYALTYGMMLGIRVAISYSAASQRKLSMDDFMSVTKMSFPPEGSIYQGYVTPPHKMTNTFKFKDYAPTVFGRIRKRFCIDEADYMMSLCGDFNFIEFISNSKSGQFFFYSHDGRFMIKTQTAAESKFLRRILPHYYQYVMQNPNTLMTRFYGMHRVKIGEILSLFVFPRRQFSLHVIPGEARSLRQFNFV